MEATRPPGSLESDRIGMHVRQSGPPGSPALVFLHGVGNSGVMWGEHMAKLGGFHCLAPDLPGFGLSNKQPWTSRIDVTDRVAELIRTQVPERRAHVVGLSLGGSIAHTLLARHPHLVNRVVIDGCGVLPWWGDAADQDGGGSGLPVPSHQGRACCRGQRLRVRRRDPG